MKLTSVFHLAVVFTLLALMLSACGGAADGEFVILEWAGYESEAYWEPYAEQYPDQPPSYSFFGDDAEAFAKAQSGFEFSVIHPCSSWWQLYVENGLVQPIDTSRLSNFDNLYPDLVALGNFNGQQYFLPWDWGYESMLVRSDLVPEMPTAWADLWDPQYAGHVSIFDSSEVAYVVAALTLDIDPYNASDADSEAIKQKLLELKPNLLNYWVDYTELSQMLAQGDIWIGANAWSDSYAILLDEGVEVEYLQPEEGRLGWVCGFGISANTTGASLDKAYAYLDAVLDTQSMANFGNEYYYGVASEEATKLLDPYIIELMDLEDPVAALNNTFFYQTISEDQRVVIEQIWTEVKAGQ
ncbi:MAG: ABC transporter substrate-binding protein [Anaerolineales bacterium]|nr:ABC transporter substrate-binding protein [Anaerolineales bacterium]